MPYLSQKLAFLPPSSPPLATLETPILRHFSKVEKRFKQLSNKQLPKKHENKPFVWLFDSPSSNKSNRKECGLMCGILLESKVEMLSERVGAVLRLFYFVHGKILDQHLSHAF